MSNSESVLSRFLTSGVENPYRYSTKEWDEKSGLYYFGFRYYSPEIGRWTQRELLRGVDGPNMYGYVRNQPTNLIDALGIYGQATHEDLTVMLAEHAGFSAELAGQVGRCNQAVDEKWPAAGSRTWFEAYHFPSRKQLETLGSKAFGDCDPCALGVYLHALQDSYAHAGFGGWSGHAEWPWADRMGLYPEKAYTMALHTYSELYQFAKTCRCKAGLEGRIGEPERWSSFSWQVRRAIREDTPFAFFPGMILP